MIDQFLNKLNDKTTEHYPRDYLGLSQTGTECTRYLQYYHRMAFKIYYNTRVSRLFLTGTLYEDILRGELERLGIKVSSNQKELITETGHWKGHVDGEGDLDGSVFLIEYKTHNDRNFKQLANKGVKQGYPGHYSQIQSYMGYGGYSTCLYVGINKNNSTIYLEWIELDRDEFKEIQSRTISIVTEPSLLPRIGNNNITWFQCKMCDAKKVCFEKIPPVRHCRTCKHIESHDKGEWKCSMHDIDLNSEDQISNCDNYKLDKDFFII